ncbi:alpha/beta fold hydrolase [Gordonia sp. LSe1-13]|uniref:Alpha/beta fold hydrolase n=1 Tax=Gordonia sesuvii TaxID=3116777 RepID=A0ABU7MER7_9ACTN|nr:alpha/beta fold hydrolase [Gordonia sp. LSe1-13]
MTRADVEFRSGPDRCRGWLYLPDTGRPAPIMVMAHGLGAVKEMRLDAFAERFCDAGYACLVFDYRHFGASDGEPRQLLSIRRQLDDWAAAIAYARTIPGVDQRRVVLWGTSFGGGHVMVAAARDGDIAAVISQCPFTSGTASVLAMDPMTTVKVTARAVADLGAVVLRRKPVMVALAGEPGDAALMTAPDVVPGYLPLVPEGHPFTNEVAARVVPTIARHHPGRALANLTCPVLICVCDQDSVAPPRQTVRYARRGPTTRLIRYPEGHFDIYVGDAFEEVVADQVDFLDRVVPLE